MKRGKRGSIAKVGKGLQRRVATGFDKSAAKQEAIARIEVQQLDGGLADIS